MSFRLKLSCNVLWDHLFLHFFRKSTRGSFAREFGLEGKNRCLGLTRAPEQGYLPVFEA